MSAREKISDYIFRYLADTVGVKHVFMLPGGGCMHLVDSLGRNPALTYVCNLHEQASAIGAEAYAQYTGNLGVTLVTAGPGSTNAITGVAGAWIDSTPMLVLSGQAKREDRMVGRGVRQMGIQEVNIEEIVRPITKYAKCVMEPEAIRYELEKAVWLATHGRKGPVWLDLPLDIQGAMVDVDRLEGFVPESASACSAEEAARVILSELRQARRPAVYAGNGIRSAGAVAAFRLLMERLNIPVLLSWKAADFLPENHPLYVGRPGIIAQRGANFVQQTCDCMLILGTRLDLCQTGFNHPHFACNARKIMVDIDPYEIDKLDFPKVFSYAMDAGQLIQSMLAQCPATETGPKAWLAQCKDWQKQYPPVPAAACDETRPLVNLYHLVDEIGRQLNGVDLLIPGSSGACAEVTMQAISVCEGLRIQNTPGLGSMGFGLPAALGGALASGKRTVVIIGDGGLQHNIQELQTLKNWNLPIKLFVLNNNGYGSIVNMQRGRFNGNFVACNPESGLVIPNLEAVASAYGLQYRKIASPAQLRRQLSEVMALPGTVFCEVMLDPSVLSEPRLASEVRADGTIVSKPMEDVFPFLPRPEFERNMSVVKHD